MKALDVDADRVDADADETPVVLDHVGLRVDAEHAQERGAKVARVVTGVEADVVGAEEPAEHLLAGREQAVDLRRRERDVEEEPDRDIRSHPPQRLRHEHQLEVVHPDAAARCAVLGNRLREALVDRHVAAPCLL